MDTTLQKWHFLRGHRGLVEKAVRVAATLGMIAGLAGPSTFAPTPAEAGTLGWSGIRTPNMAGTDTDDEPFTLNGAFQAAAGDRNSVALAPDGAVFAASAGNTSVFRSNDGGKTWTGAATGCATGVLDIVVSPKYSTDSTVIALCATAAAGVSMSTNGGVTFTGSGASTNAPISLAVAPNFSGIDGGMVCIGSAAGTASAIVQCNRWANSAWGGFFSINAGAGPQDTGVASPPAAGDAVLSLAFSPKFSTDSTLVVVFRNATNGDLYEYRVNVGTTAAGTGNFSPTPGAAFTSGATTLATTAAATSTVRIAFPSDTGDGGTVYYMCYNQDNNGVAAGQEDLYKRTGTSATGTWTAQLPGGSSTAVSCSDVAISGTLDNASIYVSDDTASPAVVRSTNGGTSWKAEEALDKDGGAIGAGATRLAISSNHATDGLVYVASAGTLGGVSKSSNRAGSWQDTGLTNTNFGAAFASLSTDGTNGFVIGCDAAACAGNESIFKTTKMEEGSAWTRVDRRANTRKVQMSPKFSEDNTVYAYVGGVTSSQLLKSTDGGQLFKVVNPEPGDKEITAIRVVSSSVLILGNKEGFVLRSNDGGGSWTSSTTDLGRDILDIEVSPNFASDNTILVGAISSSSAYEVWLSTDGGMTFSPQGTNLGAWGSGTAGSFIDVAFSPNFGAATNGDKWIFAAPSGAATDGARRFEVGKSTSWASVNITNGCTSGDTAMIALLPAPGMGDGILMYALEDAAGGDICRTYSPISSGVLNNSKLWLNSDDDSDNGLGATFAPGTLQVVANSSGNTVYVLENAGTDIGIRTFTDSSAFLVAPTLVAPVDNGSVASCQGQNGQNVFLNWATKDRVRDWDVQVATDEKFESVIIDSTGAPGMGSSNPVFLIGPGGDGKGDDGDGDAACLVADGQTYWWRVRAQDVGTTGLGVQHEGPWSASRKFSVGRLGSPTSPEPQLPLDSSTTPNVGPIQFSFNLPAGTSQYHIQIVPMNNDGPGINVIISDADMVASGLYTAQGPVMGQGNYILLPGASYTWRVRATSASSSVSETDSSWGPWSVIRTVKTPRPSAATIRLQPVTPSATPTIKWEDSNPQNFYYEVQLSQDRTFNADPATATAAVYWNLVHAGETNPLSSWMLPSGTTLEKGKTYYARVRQRVQATPLGADEPGISWSAMVSFIVP